MELTRNLKFFKIKLCQSLTNQKKERESGVMVFGLEKKQKEGEEFLPGEERRAGKN